MPQQPRELTAVESARQSFGAELRHWRKLRNLSPAKLGAITNDSGSLIEKVEKATRRPTRDFAQRMDQALDTGGVLERMWMKMNQPAWQDDSADPLVPDGPEQGWVGFGEFNPVIEWFAAARAPEFVGIGRRRIGAADLEIMWSMCGVLTKADRHLGGGYARATLLQFINATVGPALRGSYTTSTGKQLFTAAARLLNLAGFMLFDTANQGRAQQYFRRALQLAKDGDNHALGAHILTDMAMQAHYVGHPAEAVAIGEAAVATAYQTGSPSTAARSNALLARAHALHGDRIASDRAIGAAQVHLDRARPADEPEWIRFFTERQLAAESIYAAHDSGQAAEVRANAPFVLADSVGMERRHVLAAATFAGSFLIAGPHTDGVDVEKACEVLTDALPAACGLTSSRSIEAINVVRRQLAPYADLPCVQDLEQRYHQTVSMIG
ncbi:helix-turn-helix transcriptional regulator [Nocardia sp. NPDC005825]|uniref:helix-turn-helix domain-containing protein n=1 Tax=unclassified Nocardia TaxID=2637762 RepID=UPI0033FF2A38